MKIPGQNKLFEKKKKEEKEQKSTKSIKPVKSSVLNRVGVLGTRVLCYVFFCVLR